MGFDTPTFLAITKESKMEEVIDSIGIKIEKADLKLLSIQEEAQKKIDVVHAIAVIANANVDGIKIENVDLGVIRGRCTAITGIVELATNQAEAARKALAGAIAAMAEVELGELMGLDVVRKKAHHRFDAESMTAFNRVEEVENLVVLLKLKVANMI